MFVEYFEHAVFAQHTCTHAVLDKQHATHAVFGVSGGCCLCLRVRDTACCNVIAMKLECEHADGKNAIPLPPCVLTDMVTVRAHAHRLPWQRMPT